jgi:signal transduction histidine kinase
MVVVFKAGIVVIMTLKTQVRNRAILMKKTPFLSLRWQVVLPLYTVLLILGTTLAYLLAQQIDTSTAASASNILRQSQRAIEQQATALYDHQHRAAQTLALAEGVPQAILAGDTTGVQAAVAARARRANLDDALLLDAEGRALLALRRAADGADYQLIHDTLAGETLTVPDTTGFQNIAGETLLYTAVPIRWNGQVIGTVLAGQRAPGVLATLHTSALADAVLLGPDDQPLAVTLAAAGRAQPRALNAINTLTIDQNTYQALYFPLALGDQRIGTVGVLLPEGAYVLTAASRQVTGLLLASLVALVLVLAFVGMSSITRRLERVRRTAEALGHGEQTARTGMKPVDEVGQLGQALDQYADYVQERQDALRSSLRRQRRENERLIAVLEALPDGVVVQDLDGRVVMMNEIARELLGSRRALRSMPDLQELTAFVTDQLGPALAPGIHLLGEPHQITLDNRTLSAQIAAVVTAAGQRIGTVIVLRDLTQQIEAEAAREKILRQLEEQVQEPLGNLAQTTRPLPPADEFSREMRQHAATLQKSILSMRELSDDRLRAIKDQQQPLPLDTLVWSVANEWRQVALAQNLTLHVMIEQHGLYVLGEERRLRWAIGNLIDNAIKYTPPGGALSLEVLADTSQERAHLRVRDNGVGIARDELPHVLTRFYRGKPVTKEGREIRVPGSGQGLTMAQRIIEAHGGELTIRSRQGVGTAVYFSLPLTADVSYALPRLTPNLEDETARIDTRLFQAQDGQSQT